MNSTISYRPTPDSLRQYVGDEVLTMITKGHAVSGIEIEPEPDWSGYGNVRVTVFNPGRHSVRVSFRVDDRYRAWEYGEWWAKRFVAAPGESTAVIPLDDRKLTKGFREMDLENVRRILLHIPDAPAGTVLFFGDISLD